MIVMLNGAFGAGKSTLAVELIARRPDWLLFDPEEVGAMLWKVCPGPRGDFQELAAWAPLVVETARALASAYGRTLVVPMTLIHPGNHATIRRGFESIAPTRHFTLLASRETLVRRLDEREGRSDTWSHGRIDECVAALASPGFAVHLDADQSAEALATVVLSCVVE